MSDRQALADICTSLCVAGLGISAGLAAVALPLVKLAALGLDMRERCEKRAMQKAVTRAAKALDQAQGLSGSDISTALATLRDAGAAIRLDPAQLAARAGTDDLPDVLFDLIHQTGLVARDGGSARAIRIALDAAYAECRTLEGYHRIFTQEVLIDLARRQSVQLTALDRIEAKVDDHGAMLRELLARVQGDPAHAQEWKTREARVIALAERYAEGSPGEFDAAYRGLERALEIAAQRPSGDNLGTEVQAIITEVERLNDAGAVDDAMAALRQAQAARLARIEEERAALMGLYDRGIAQAVLTRSVTDAVAAELGKLDLEVPEPARRFDALRDVQDGWFARGRDRGLTFDLEVAVMLARHTYDMAPDRPHERAALNDLALALQILGERSPDPGHLEEAVAAGREMLRDWPDGEAPEHRVVAQTNLGNALAILGQRERGTARLEQAVAAYRTALHHDLLDHKPDLLATVLMNLANTLKFLGDREDRTTRTEEAVMAYRDALAIWTRDRAPMDWAMVNGNLGNALMALGQRDTGTGRLEDAVACFRSALEERTRTRAPMEWALTRMNLGIALQLLGQRLNDPALLREAITAMRDALEVRTRDLLPLEWARTQNNLGTALLMLGQWDGAPSILEEAAAAFRAALLERTRARVPLDWAATQNNLGNTLRSLGQYTPGTAVLAQAAAALELALEVRTRSETPLDWAATRENLALVEEALAFKSEGQTREAHLHRAIAHIEAALEVYDPATAPLLHQAASTTLAELRGMLVPH